MNTPPITTMPFRIGFPSVFEPRTSTKYPNSEPKYSIQMIFPANGQPLLPDRPGDGILQLRQLAVQAATATWGPDQSKWPELSHIDYRSFLSRNGKDGWPIRDGDLVEWDGFKGMVFAKASSTNRPACVDAQVQGVIDPSKLASGMICVANINAFTTKSGGIGFGLNAVQILVDDGKRFGSNVDAQKVFSAYGAPTAAPMANPGAWGITPPAPMVQPAPLVQAPHAVDPWGRTTIPTQQAVPPTAPVDESWL